MLVYNNLPCARANIPMIIRSIVRTQASITKPSFETGSDMSFTDRDTDRESGDVDSATPIMLDPPYLGTMSPAADAKNWTARLTERYNSVADNLNARQPTIKPLLQTLIRAQEELRDIAAATEFHNIGSHTSNMDAHYDGGTWLPTMRATRHPLTAWGQLLRAVYVADWYLRLMKERLQNTEKYEKWRELMDVVLEEMPI